MIFDFVKTGTSRFLPVTSEDIQKLEEIIGKTIPNELLVFYKEIGYGFLNTKNFNIDRFMDPISVMEFRTKTGIYENYPYIDAFDNFQENKLIFFEQDESAYFSIEINSNESSRIFYYETVIADSLEEFLKKMMENDEYYFELVSG